MLQLKRLVRLLRALSFRRNSAAVGDIDGASGLLRRVPAGFLAVYVGPEKRRFVIPTRFLTSPVFSSLLTHAEEFGFSPGSGLALPCAAEFFRRVLEILDSDEARFRDLALEGFQVLSGLAGPETFVSPLPVAGRWPPSQSCRHRRCCCCTRQCLKAFSRVWKKRGGTVWRRVVMWIFQRRNHPVV